MSEKADTCKAKWKGGVMSMTTKRSLMSRYAVFAGAVFARVEPVVSGNSQAVGLPQKFYRKLPMKPP